MKTLGIALAGGLLIALTAGCPKDPYDPDTWIEKLDEPKEAGEALQRLQQLKDPKAIKPLGEFWKSHRHPSKVLRILIELASYQRVDPKTGEVKYGPTYEPAIPYLIEAVDQFDIGDQQSIDDAVVAADALGRAAELGIQSPEAVTTLIAAVKKDIPKLSPGQRVRIGAVRALGYMKDPRAVDLLIDVLTTPPTKQPIKLNAAAANALANQADPKAIQPLLKTMFALPPVYQQVRTALTAIGKPVVPELVKIFKGQHKELNRYAKEQNFANDCDKGQGPNTTCKAPGALKFKAATLLGDFR
ncbi:MAG: HEAT repeat domain-containing protein, partial [Deltaproteobacteria bacterium]